MKRGGGGGGGGGGAGAGMCPAAAPLRFTQGPGRLQTPPGTAGRDGAGGMGEGGRRGAATPLPARVCGVQPAASRGEAGPGFPAAAAPGLRSPPVAAAALLPLTDPPPPPGLLGSGGSGWVAGVWGWLVVVFFNFFFKP